MEMEIIFSNFSKSVAKLIGKGSPRLENGHYVLEGQLQLQILNFTSDWSDLLAVEVKETNGTWELFDISTITHSTLFKFSNNIHIQQVYDEGTNKKHGPWLNSKTVVLSKAPTTDTNLSFDTLSVSLLPGIDSIIDRKLRYPLDSSGNKYKEVDITYIQKDGKYGYFLTIDKNSQGEQYIGIQFKGPAGGFFIDNITYSRIGVFNDAVFTVYMSDQKGNALLPSAPFLKIRSEQTKAAVDVKNETLLNLPKSILGNYTRLNTKSVEVSGNWLSVPDFTNENSNPEIRLLRLADDLSVPENPTSLFGTADRFSFHLPIIPDEKNDVTAHFVYLDKFSDKPSLWNAYYGLRIQGLGWNKGVIADKETEMPQARLDANYVRVGLKSNRFEFQGGKEIKIRDEIKNSVILPKPDRANNLQRILDLPVGNMTLRCQYKDSKDLSPITFDTSESSGQLKLSRLAVVDKNGKEVEVYSPVLLGPPLGARAFEESKVFTIRDGKAEEELKYNQWMLTLKNDKNDVAFVVNPKGIYPSLKNEKWLNAFKTDTTNPFPLLEYPGSKISIDPPKSSGFTVLEDINTELCKVTEIDKDTRKEAEKFVYKKLSTGLSYKKIDNIFDDLNNGYSALSEDDIIMQAEDLLSKEWVKLNELAGVIFAYKSDIDESKAKITEFINKYIQKNFGNISQFVWPLYNTLGILLWQKKNGAEKYCHEIVKDLDGKLETGLGFKFNNTKKFLDDYLGWEKDKFTEFKNEAPALWSSVNDGLGKRFTPLVEQWRGVIFRDMPLIIKIPEDFKDKLKNTPLGRFIDKINDNLILKYGWKDESGSTWKASITFKDKENLLDEKEKKKESWKDYLQITPEAFNVEGAEGKMLKSEAELQFVFPQIKDKNEAPTKINAAFTLNLAGGALLGKLELVPKEGSISIESIPGFDKIEFVRLSTDLKTTCQIKLKLYPHADLAEALPFLKGKEAKAGSPKEETPIEGTIPLNISGTPAFKIAVTLPSETQTNLFGKWQMSVQGMSIELESGNLTTIIRGRVNLGLASFSSVGVMVKISGFGSSWSLNVMIEDIGGSLDLGDFHATLKLGWKKSNNEDGGELRNGNIKEGASREFWGNLGLHHAGGLFPDLGEISLRIGTKGEMAFWVAAYKTDEIKIGAITFKKPAIVLAHNADYLNKISTDLSDASNEVMRELRPPDKDEKKEVGVWLGDWQPSEKIGLFIGLSGYLVINDKVLAAKVPEEKEKDDPEHLTAIALTDTGIIRFDAVANFLETFPVRFSIGVDLKQKIFTAAFSLIGDTDYKEFVIHPGQIVIGMGYGSDNIYFRLSVGWPERIGKDEFERDWSKSIMIRWDNIWPVNTFWGGFKAEIKSGNALIIGMGFALRAGWTWEKKLPIAGNLVGGQADFGWAVGGVFEMRYPREGASMTDIPSRHNRFALKSPASSHGTSPMLNDDNETAFAIRYYQSEIEQALVKFNKECFDLEASFYADMWAHASGSICGVTIASLEVKVYARLHLCSYINLSQPNESKLVSRCAGKIGFETKIKVGCIYIPANGQIEATMIDGACSCG